MKLPLTGWAAGNGKGNGNDYFVLRFTADGLFHTISEGLRIIDEGTDRKRFCI